MKGILIFEEHSGRFGNKMLHYNNAGQLAQHYGCEVYTINGEMAKAFKVNLLTEEVAREHISEPGITTDIHSLLEKGLDNVGNQFNSITLDPCLGRDFFDLEYDTRKIFQLKDDVDIKKEDGQIVIAMHFRGTDFIRWNPLSILSPDYYTKSIDYCLIEYPGCKFKLYTDDRNMNSFKATIQHLTNKKAPFELGKTNAPFLIDFVDMANADVIVSTPSTFCIGAALIKGKKDIIHSQHWLDSRVADNDKFWIGVNNGGNDNYKLKKTF